MITSEFSSIRLADTLGPNLTKIFGLGQLPPVLTADIQYQTKSERGNPIYTAVRHNRVSIADEPEGILSRAVFAAEAVTPRSLKYALYTRQGNNPPNSDFQHHAAEFMVKTHQYLLEVLAIPITTIVADWFAGEEEFRRFSRAYDHSRYNLVEAVQNTWSAPIIMDQLRYSYVTADPHALRNLSNQRVIEVEFSKTVRY